MLVTNGEDINDVSNCMHRQIIGTGQLDGPAVPGKIYQSQKHPRFGNSNPEDVRYALWMDMIQSDVSAWRARDKYDDTACEGNRPVWCYERFGRTTNLLPDGRIIEIAGEHEDSYDPDFCIYNDVVVFESDKTFRIFCYPEADFPPTDFHTATLVDGNIIIIGCLGYPESRRVGQTPVYSLDINTLRISKVSTSGEAPGWISGHKTKLVNRELVVSGGEVWIEHAGSFDLVSNQRQYTLCLESFSWHAGE